MSDILVFKNLTKQFGKHNVLDNLSFHIPKGHVVGLVGPNGSGKSTIMKCILGIYPYEQGALYFEGQKITSKNVNQMSSKTGALIESPSIYPFLTGMQHFKLYSATKADVADVVNLMGMGKYINSKVTRYSFGMKQKLGIALALINKPELVTLDEPMNGLDLMATLDLRKIITSEAQRGVTFIVSSHILSELEKISDDIILINNGKMVFQTTMPELRGLGQRSYILTTNDNKAAKKLLLQHRFVVADNGSSIQIDDSAHQLNDFLTILIENHIQLLDISHQGMDLETATLRYIKGSRGVFTMIDLLKQEFFKLVHQKGILFSPLVLFGLMLFVGISSKHTGDLNYYTTQSFAGGEWLDILLIIASANIVTMEFEHGTIKHMIAQHNNRFLIYFTKMIVVSAYCVVLHGFMFIFTIIVKYISYGSTHPFGAIYDNNQTVMQNLMIFLFSNLFSCLLIITIVFLIASLSRTSSIAAVVGLLFIFMGTPISNLLIRMVGNGSSIIKWNPGNMFNVAFQFLTPGTIHTSLLSDGELVIGNLVWAGLFIAVGYYAFKKKRI
ncbi:ATP-binding cassette domain-containing protein [Lentilactobacillus otakiensis]|uniref:ATP-binding cassette domain-containing protein n=1 Tax=Lentilactobacillus otakiensis TaxID=481720 RepID=UPI003D176C92